MGDGERERVVILLVFMINLHIIIEAASEIKSTMDFL
jgi:hypothetical protein